MVGRVVKKWPKKSNILCGWPLTFQIEHFSIENDFKTGFILTDCHRYFFFKQASDQIQSLNTKYNTEGALGI